MGALRSVKRKVVSSWLCPRCSLVQSRRAFSSNQSHQQNREHEAGVTHRDGALHGGIREAQSGRQPSRKLVGLKNSRTSTTKRVFSLIQPTGIPHLGNYLGALRKWKQLQDEGAVDNSTQTPSYSLMFGLADLHSLTQKRTRREREADTRSMLASLLAIGLNPDHCTIFVQSHVPLHTELMWFLSTLTSMGRLFRMTQWKDKIGAKPTDSIDDLDDKAREQLNLSLFSYPVLQAADVLLYQTDLVPVGEDQRQHIELARGLAKSFNSHYSTHRSSPLLTVPEAMISPAARVMSLQNPDKKMSKSDRNEMSRVLITDSPEEIRHKFKQARTDSVPGPITYDPETRPGVSNLLDIWRHTSGSSDVPGQEFAAKHAQMSLGQLKHQVAEAVIHELQGVKEQYEQFMRPGHGAIELAMLKGCQSAKARADVVMRNIRSAIGLSQIHDQQSADPLREQPWDRVLVHLNEQNQKLGA